jgi:nitroreductase
MRSRSSYTYRTAHLEVGAFVQRALLVATAVNLRTFITAALDDARVESLLGTDDGRVAPSFVVALGRRPSWHWGTAR